MIEILEVDSVEYHILENACQQIKGVPGFTCEIGLRMGGGSSIIMRACIQNDDKRIHVAIDPYGNIDYRDLDARSGKRDYTNAMKNSCLQRLFQWCNKHGAEFLFFNLEDIEFFQRYGDGIPVYEGEKQIVNQYALVHFDGPHSLEEIRIEVDFFLQRTPLGGMWVFDDTQQYDHSSIEQYMAGAFILFEKGSRKAAYRRIRL